MGVLWDPQTITVVRHADTQVSDGQGGWIDAAPHTVFSGLVDVFVPRGVNETRDEAAPGIVTTKIRRFIFLANSDGSYPDLKTQDRITWLAEIYTVKFTWVFIDEMHVEGWVLE
jgi:hypothetical protein